MSAIQRYITVALVASPNHRNPLQDALELVHLAITQAGDAFQVLRNLVDGPATRDWDNSRHARLAAQSEKPGQCDLNRGHALARGQILDLVDQLDVFLHGFILILRQHLPEIAIWDLRRAGESPRQHTSAQRRVSHNRDIELSADLGNVVVEDCGVPKGQLNLYSCNWVDLVTASGQLPFWVSRFCKGGCEERTLVE